MKLIRLAITLAIWTVAAAFCGYFLSMDPGETGHPEPITTMAFTLFGVMTIAVIGVHCGRHGWQVLVRSLDDTF